MSNLYWNIDRTANTLTIYSFYALSIGGSLVAVVRLCMKREDIYRGNYVITQQNFYNRRIQLFDFNNLCKSFLPNQQKKQTLSLSYYHVK